MSFLSPAALWFSLALLPLAAIYLLRVKPEQFSTSTLFLWDRVFKEKRASALFRHLRDLLSLLIMLLAVIAIVLAMARPIIDWKDRKQDLVLIIDNSASMQAEENGRSRLDKAIETAENIIKNLNPGQLAVLASVADELEIIVSSTDNPRDLLAGLEQIKPTSIPFQVTELTALKKHEQLVSSSRMILISDGCFENPEKLAGIELLKIGTGLGNAGVNAFDLIRLPKDNQLGLYFQLTSSFKAPRKIDIILAHVPQNKDLDHPSDIASHADIVKIGRASCRERV